MIKFLHLLTILITLWYNFSSSVAHKLVLGVTYVISRRSNDCKK